MFFEEYDKDLDVLSWDEFHAGHWSIEGNAIGSDGCEYTIAIDARYIPCERRYVDYVD